MGSIYNPLYTLNNQGFFRFSVEYYSWTHKGLFLHPFTNRELDCSYLPSRLNPKKVIQKLSVPPIFLSLEGTSDLKPKPLAVSTDSNPPVNYNHGLTPKWQESYLFWSFGGCIHGYTIQFLTPAELNIEWKILVSPSDSGTEAVNGYCWWPKSCTSWGWQFFPLFSGVHLYIPCGEGFLPSTVGNNLCDCMIYCWCSKLPLIAVQKKK